MINKTLKDSTDTLISFSTQSADDEAFITEETTPTDGLPEYVAGKYYVKFRSSPVIPNILFDDISLLFSRKRRRS